MTAWLELNVNSSEALAELTSRLNQIRYELPDEALDPSVEVLRTDQANALFYLDVDAGAMSRAELTDYMARNVTPILASIDGVQRIGFEGGRDPAMRVWLDPARMASVGIGADTVITALRDNNVLAAIGRTQTDAQQINLLSNATLRTAADFEELVVSNTDGALVRLRDIARIELGEDRGDDLVRKDQMPTIFLSVWTLPGSNAIAVGDEVYVRLEKINATLPQGVRINTAYDATVYMRRAIGEIVTTLVETVALVGIVVVLMMGSLRTALVPLVTIPISILGTIAVIHAMGFTLNLLTILAVVLCVGLVVDDAIVVVENVARHMREGKSRLQAALASSRELTAPVIAMTLTLAAVYAPIGFVSGLTGALFREFTFTLAVAVLISGLVALTLSPVMSARVNSERGQEAKGTLLVNHYFDVVRAVYTRALDTVLAWRSQALFVGLFAALLLMPFYMFSAKELAPVEDEGGLQVVARHPLVVDRRELAPGAELGHTLGHRPPHPPGAREVVARAGVVDATRLGGGDAALDGAHLLGDVEVSAREVGDHLVGLALHPLPQRGCAVQLVGRVVVEVVDGRLDAGPGKDPLGRGHHVGGDARELLLPPRVGLLEVDRSPEELARGELVALPSARVRLGSHVEQVLAEVRAEPPVGVGGRLHATLQICPHAGVEVVVPGACPGQEAGEEPFGRGELAALGHALAHLAPRGDQAATGRLPQRPGVLRQRAGHAGEAGRDRGPVLLGAGGHEVEDVTTGLHRRGEDVELHPVVAGLVGLEGETQPLAHGRERDGVDGIDRIRRLQTAQGVAGECRVVGVALRREVVELGLASGHAQVGGLDGAGGHDGVEVGLGDGVDGGGLASRGRRGHPVDATRPPPGGAGPCRPGAAPWSPEIGRASCRERVSSPV